MTVERWWSLLGRDDSVAEATTLSGGSGSGVHQVVTDRGERFVLKVGTTVRELRFYRELAPRVPVRVPRFAGGVEYGDTCCVLLEPAGTAIRPAGRWTELATQLGRLHREPADMPWAKPLHVPTEADIATAAAAWDHGTLVLPAFHRMAAALTALPVCLCHGDWHLGNLLDGGDGQVVWIDWQETGAGHGPEELALLWQRAERDGWDPPRDAMLTAYADARGIPDDLDLRRAAVATELTLLLLEWPPHLAAAPPWARARLVSRFERLVEASVQLG